MIELVAHFVRDVLVDAGFSATLRSYVTGFGQFETAWTVRVGGRDGLLIYGCGEDRVGWHVSESGIGGVPGSRWRVGAVVPTYWANISDPDFDVKLLRAFRERMRLLGVSCG